MRRSLSLSTQTDRRLEDLQSYEIAQSLEPLAAIATVQFVEIRRLGASDIQRLIADSSWFDRPVSHEWASFSSPARTSRVFAHDDEASNGFVSEVELTHRDKGTELFLRKLCLAQEHGGKGVGRAL